ncbi:hypothetical protein POWCR01_110025500 [Plasmodium ovale]|uniref:Uncharacterized protein n=1 Tax=Plasmodium ovale TaxID=36330 RepID=A0A1C3KU17_PLAOA|nr:hypothetical protein POWCR01_110025500 [Plasmodium ovale]
MDICWYGIHKKGKNGDVKNGDVKNGEEKNGEEKNGEEKNGDVKNGEGERLHQVRQKQNGANYEGITVNPFDDFS